MNSYGIELTDDQVDYIKVSFNVGSDAQVRNLLQDVVQHTLFRNSPLTVKELDDLNAMKDASKIRG